MAWIVSDRFEFGSAWVAVHNSFGFNRGCNTHTFLSVDISPCLTLRAKEGYCGMPVKLAATPLSLVGFGVHANQRGAGIFVSIAACMETSHVTVEAGSTVEDMAIACSQPLSSDYRAAAIA